MSGIVGGINLRSSGLVNISSASDGTVFTGTGVGLPVDFEAAAGGGYTSEALVSLTSGATKDITIASGVTSIVIHFNLISSSGGDSVLCMQLGDAGGIETSGYISAAMSLNPGVTASTQDTLLAP